jgi:hypothetical protein
VADDLLSIRVTADISSLQAQMQAGAASVQAAGENMSSAWQEVTQASLSYQAAQKEVRVLTDQVSKAIVGETVTAREQQQAIEALTAAKQRAAAAAKELAAAEKATTAAIEQETFSTHEARGAAALFGDETGIKLNRHLRSVVASSETLGPLLEAAFPVAAAIGFYEVAEHVGEKLSEVISDTFIYTQAQKDEYAAQVALNQGIAEQVAKLDQLKQAYDLIGLSGSARLKVQFEQLTEEVKKNEQALSAAKDTAFLYQRGMGVSGLSGGEISAQEYAQAQKDVARLTAIVATGQQEQANLEKEYDQAKAAEDKEAAQTAVQTQQQVSDKLFRVYQIIAKAHEDLAKAVEKDDNQTAKQQAQDLEDQLKAQLRANEEYLKETEAKTKASLAAIEGEWKVAQTKLKGQESVVEGESARGQISKVDELEQLRTLHQQELTEEANFVRQMILIAAQFYSADSKEMVDLQNRLKLLNAQAGQEWTKDTQAILTAQQQRYTQFFSIVSHGFTTALNGWLQGTQSFSKAATKLYQSLEMDVVEYVEKLGEKWITTHVLMTAANALFHTQSAAQDAAGEASQQAITSATNVATATSDAAVAAGATLAYYSAFAPELAPAMAAAQYGVGLGFAGMAAFQYGGVVPKTQVALVHGGERVLTPGQNSAFERMSRNGGSFSAPITQHIHGVSDPMRAARLSSTMAVARVRRLASDWGYR